MGAAIGNSATKGVVRGGGVRGDLVAEETSRACLVAELTWLGCA